MINKKISSEIAIGIILLLTIIIGGVFWLQNINQVPIEQKKQNSVPENSQDQNLVKENTVPKITEKIQDNLKEVYISEAGIRIEFPKDYEITKNTRQKNRRGSYVSYDFSTKDNSPSFNEIQFFSKESIDEFTKNCGEGPCFFGDFPNVERYIGQKNAFETNKEYLNYKLKKFNDRSYFTSNFKCDGDSCVIREYATFIGSTKIDVWITMVNESQVIEADKLFESFKIVE